MTQKRLAMVERAGNKKLGVHVCNYDAVCDVTFGGDSELCLRDDNFVEIIRGL